MPPGNWQRAIVVLLSGGVEEIAQRVGVTQTVSVVFGQRDQPPPALVGDRFLGEVIGDHHQVLLLGHNEQHGRGHERQFDHRPFGCAKPAFRVAERDGPTQQIDV